MTAASERQSSAPDHWRLIGDRLQTALVTPIRAMRLRYLPLLMIYHAYGALGLVTIAEAFWIKEALADPGGARCHRRAALDHQNGLRPARGFRADPRFGAPS